MKVYVLMQKISDLLTYDKIIEVFSNESMACKFMDILNKTDCCGGFFVQEFNVNE